MRRVISFLAGLALLNTSASRFTFAPAVQAHLLMLKSFSPPFAADDRSAWRRAIRERDRRDNCVNIGSRIVYYEHQLDDDSAREINGCIARAVRIHRVCARLIGVKSRMGIRIGAWDGPAQRTGHNEVLLAQIAGAVETGGGDACAGVYCSVGMEDLARDGEGVIAFERPIRTTLAAHGECRQGHCHSQNRRSNVPSPISIFHVRLRFFACAAIPGRVIARLEETVRASPVANLNYI